MAHRKRTTKKKSEPTAETLFAILMHLLDLLICVYLILLLAVLPFYNSDGFNTIGTDKAHFFLQSSSRMWKIIIPVALVTFCVDLVRQKKSLEKWKAVGKHYVQQFTLTDYFALFYGGAVLLSYLCSNYQAETLEGSRWWYMGTQTQLSLVGIYLLTAKAWRRHKWMLYMILPISAVVFLLGLVNRFGFFPIDMNLESGGFISTIGNINWYCGYIVLPFFVGVGLLWMGKWKKWQVALLGSYVLIGFATLVTQGSASGIFTMVVMILIQFCLSAKDGESMEHFWREMLLLSVACLLVSLTRSLLPERINYTDALMDLLTVGLIPFVMTIVSLAFHAFAYGKEKKGEYPDKLFGWLARFVGGGSLVLLGGYLLITLIHTLYPESMTFLSDNSVFTFNADWGSKRGATWSAGWRCFAEQDLLHKLAGVGPDGMSAFLYADGSQGLRDYVNAQFGANNLLANAHNEWLTILVDTGLLGLAGYAGLIITAVHRLVKRRKVQLIAGACGLSVLAYSCNNIFSFQQAMSTPTMFILLGMGMAFAGEEKEANT